MKLYDLRVTVERIEGRSVCGLEVGDFFDVTESSRVRIPAGRHFCLYALQAVLPLLPAKMRRLPAEDWLEQDNLVCCPDPEEGLVMRIERLREGSLVTGEVTEPGRSAWGCSATSCPATTRRSHARRRPPASTSSRSSTTCSTSQRSARC